MNEVRGDFWRQHGTSLIWDAAAIEGAAANGITVSLREALGWSLQMPDEPPNQAQTIVVTGLQAALEAISPQEIDELLKRVARLVREHSRRWPEAAIVFAARSPERFADPTPSGAINLRLADGSPVDIAEALWNGTKRDARLVAATITDNQGRESTKRIGWWLRRVS